MPLLVIDNKRKRVQEWASSNYERLYEQMHAEEQEARNKTADEIYARQQQASTKYFQLRNGVLDALGQVQQNSGQDFFRRER
jgi:ribosomal protein L29